VRAGLRRVLDRDWLFVGELHGMRFYHKPGRVIGFEREGDDFAHVYVGASSEAELAAVARDLSLQWEEPQYPAFYAKGMKISYSVQGEGEPVVLIHGLFGSSVLEWTFFGTTDLLAGKYQVITLDLPGHGRSDKPTTEEAYGLELVKDVIRLMDHLQINKAHVVGNCLGGIVAAKLMARHPDRVLSGTLAGMGWLRGRWFAQKVFEHFRQTAGDAVRTCARTLGKLALTKKEVESIRAPVIILAGERDEVVKKLYVEPLRAVRKDWRVVTIRSANHLNFHSKPQFKEEIAKWLAKQARR
jgi:pimeloyl-ACP methyl ester carboxylesterase